MGGSIFVENMIMRRNVMVAFCRHLLIALATVLPVSGMCGQQPPVSADQAMPRTDQNSLTAHAQLLEKAATGRIDIYFEGDSITRRWGATDCPEFLANWKQNFFG